MTTTRTRRPIAAHGTLSRYKHHKCKCETCRTAYTAYQRSRYRRRAYGTWQPFVDAEPIRQHILTLHAGGMSYASIAQAAGMYEATVTGFIYALSAKDPRKEKATPEIAARILAVTPDPMLSGWVDVTGTRRRIQALAANGWPMSALADFIGVNSGSVNRITRQTRVYADTARAVADVYVKYATASPQDQGIPQWKSDRHRREAQAKQWPDPTWWEDMGHIDDPTFDPQAVVEHPMNRLELAAYRRDEIERLNSYRVPDHEIAARLDMALTTVRGIIGELESGQRRDRNQAA